MKARTYLFSRFKGSIVAGVGVLVVNSLFACAGPSYYDQGEAAARKGDWNQAVIYYERAYQRDPYNRRLELALLEAREKIPKNQKSVDTKPVPLPVPSVNQTKLSAPAAGREAPSPADTGAVPMNLLPPPSSPAIVDSPMSGVVPGLTSAPGVAPIAPSSSGSVQTGGSGPSGQTAQSQPAIVSLIPPSGPISVGQNVDIQVAVSNVDNLFAAPFYFYYNPANFTVETVTEGSFLNQDGNSTVFLKSVDPSLGRVIVGLTRLGAVPGVGGSGTLATVTFKVMAPGQASMTLANANFKDPELNAISLQVKTALIEIR